MLEGVYEGIENGYFVGQIADSAYRFQREINAGRRVVVGVNEFTDGNEDDEINLLRIDPIVETTQRASLEAVKARRDQAVVDRCLGDVAVAAADPTQNLMPLIMEAVKVYATLEEISSAMESVFGTYVERSIV